MASADLNGSTGQTDEVKDEKSGESENSRYDSKTLAYMENILKEKHVLNTNTYPIASRLLEEEISKTKQSGQPFRDYRYIDIFREKPMKVVVKVMVPIREYPKFNFVGKLLGPKGNTLRRLQEETMCKMTILGRGSMKDKIREEELRQGLDPKYSHLSDDLHVEVSTLAPPSEAHGRMSYALKELRRYLIPDANDEISQEQLRELESYGGIEGSDEVAAPAAPPAETKQRLPQLAFRGKRPPGANLPSGASRAKVMSILEKARNAMENSKGYSPMPQNNYDRRNSTRPLEEYPEEFDQSRFEAPSRLSDPGLMRPPLRVPSDPVATPPPRPPTPRATPAPLRMVPRLSEGNEARDPGHSANVPFPGTPPPAVSWSFGVKPGALENSRRQWNRGFKMTSAPPRFLTRSAPYSRP